VRAIQCVHLIVFPSTVDLPLSNPESAGTSQDTSPCEVLYPLIEHEDVLLRVKGQRDILHEIRKRKANWICHILRKTAFYNGLLKER